MLTAVRSSALSSACGAGWLAVHVLTVTPAIQYAMLVVICLGAAFLLTVFACLVYYRKHKARPLPSSVENIGGPT